MPRLPDIALRAVFLVELAVLALPSLYLLGMMAGILAMSSIFGAGYGFSAGTGQGLAGEDIAISLVVAALGLFLSLCGFYAMWHFLRAALAYLRHGAAGLHRRNLGALPWAIPPLALTLTLGLPALLGGEGWSRLIALHLSGLGLLVPTLHLWLAWRARPSPATSASPS